MKKLTKSLSLILLCLVFASAAVFSASALDRVTGLKVASKTYNSIKISWNAVSGAAGYDIQMRKGSGAWSTVAENYTSGTTYTAKNLSTGSEYSFQVRAYDYSGLWGTKKASSYSHHATAKVTVGKVTGVKTSRASMTSAKLSWSKVTGATGYQVQKYVDGKWKGIGTTTKLSFTAKNLTVGKSTSFRVRAYRTVSGSKKYGSVSATVKFTAGVPKVSSASITSTYNSATLSWKAVSGATGYQVYKYDYSDKGWKKVKTLKAGTVKYTDKTLKTGTKYAFKVRAYQKYNGKTYYGAYCSNVYVTPTLNKVSSLKLSSISATKATLTWNKVTGATGYLVYDYSTGSAVRLALVKTNAATFTIADGKAYEIKVRAYTKINGKTIYGNMSSVFDFSSRPEVVKAFKGTATEAGIKFTWDSSKTAKGYNLYAYNTSTSQWEKFATTTSTSYTIKSLDLAPGNIFLVRAYVKNGSEVLESKNSEAITVELLKAPLVSVGQCTETDIELVWNAVSGAEYYVVEIYKYNENTWEKAGETAATNYVDYGFEGRSSIYRVYAVSASGEKGLTSKHINAATLGITLTQNGATQTLTWLSVEGAAQYRILAKYRNTNRGLYYIVTNVSTNSATLCLTPGAIHSIAVYAYDSANIYKACAVEEIVFKADAPAILPQGSANYNESVNGQLLYLIEAINNTKLETSKVTVKSDSLITYATDKFYLGSYEIDSKDIDGLVNLLDKFFPSISDADIAELRSITLTNEEKIAENLTFTDGLAVNSYNKTVSLAKFVEPSELSTTELYDWQNPSAWKNGFSSVKTTALSDGSYEFEIMLKQESFGTSVNKTSPYYHPCFATTLASLSSLQNGEMENELSTIGETKINAVVNADGTLDSYHISSPFTIKMMATINEGAIIEKFGMKMKGNIASEYIFTR